MDETVSGALGVAHNAVRWAFPVVVEAAIDLGGFEEADRLTKMLAARPRGEVPPFLRAQPTRAKGLLAGVRGENKDVEESLVAAEAALRGLGYPYWAARVQLDRAEWLKGQARLEESAKLATEAAAAFEALGAAPMLARTRDILEPELVLNSGTDGSQRAVAQSRPSPSE
jgi:hypothetical protein